MHYTIKIFAAWRAVCLELEQGSPVSDGSTSPQSEYYSDVGYRFDCLKL